MKNKILVLSVILMVSVATVSCDFPGQKEPENNTDAALMLVFLSIMSLNNLVNDTVTDTYICVNAPTNCTQYIFAGTPSTIVNSLGSSCTGAGDVWTQGGTCAAAGYNTYSTSGMGSGYSYTIYTP